MKKCFRKILGGVMALAMFVSGIGVNAAASMEVDWYGDYSDSSNPKLVVEIQSPALYKQQVTVVVYPSSVTNPTITDYIRVKEVSVNGSDKTTVTFNVTDKFNAPDNHYKIDVQGSGYMVGESTAQKDVYIFTSSNARSLLAQINSANESEITGVIEAAQTELKITPEDDPVRDAGMGRILVGMRTNENGGAFASLEVVKTAWAAADVIAALTDTTSTASDVASKINTNAAAIGLAITDKDYSDNSLEVSQYLLNNGRGVNTVSGLKKLFGQCVGIAVMNNSGSAEAPSNLDKYLSYFDVNSTLLTKYNTGISDVQRAQVAGAMYRQNIQTPGEFVNKFENAVNTLPNTSATPTPSPTSNPGGNNNGGTGISGPGSTTPTPSPAPTVTPDASASGYSDMSKSHWADNYVAELSKKGIINGYDDNTFRPDNNVVREEFVKMIITGTGLYDANAESDFDDILKSDWAYKYIASAYKNGIVSGVSDTTFGVGTNITRQDVAVIAARILSYLGKSTSTGATTLTDIDSVSDYAQDSVKLLNSMGIINGFDDGSFMPHNALTRAEAAAIISKLISNL